VSEKNPYKLANKKANDSFQNINKELGTGKDPRQGTFFIRNAKIDQMTANNLYVTNWLGANVVDVPADESVKNWRELDIEDDNQLAAFEAEETRINLKQSFAQARKWANVFGGAIIVMIVDDGQNLSVPLNINTIKKDSLKRLIVMDRWEVSAMNIERDLLNENFGNPTQYLHGESGQMIHHTRVLKFNGDSPTIREVRENNGWGLSIYEKIMLTIQDAMTSSDLISGLLFESNVDVYKIAGLNEAVEAEQDDLAIKRIKLANELKSTINAIALDKEDDLVKVFASFAGLAEIDDRFLQKVAGSSKIPATKLLGTQTKGLGNGQEGDLTNYYDMVNAIQENQYSPNLITIDSVMSMSLFGKDIGVTFEYRPLFQLTEQEQADVDLKNAQRDEIYLRNNVVDDSMVLDELNSNKTYGDITEFINGDEEVNNESVVDK
jgi:phage-related protein (TIGR01555 family)